MIRTSDPWAGLDDFHRTMLDFISGIRGARNRARAGPSSGDRSSIEDALVESVTSQLAAAATESAISPVDPGGDALVTACRTVGQALGIEVRATADWWSGWNRAVERPAGRPGAGLGFSRAAGHASRRTGGAGREASRCWADWPTGGDRRSHSSRRRAACHGPSPHTVCAITKAGSGLSTSSSPQKLDSRAWTIYRTLPDEPQRKLDLFRFSLRLPGLARELWMVFLMALVAAILGLSIPVAAGILVDQVIPEADREGLVVMCGVPGRPGLLGCGVPRDPGAHGAAHRRTGVGDDHPGGVGPIAPASHGFLRQVQLRRSGLRAMEFTKVFKKVSGATVTTMVMGLFALVQPGPAFLL